METSIPTGVFVRANEKPGPDTVPDAVMSPEQVERVVARTLDAQVVVDLALLDKLRQDPKFPTRARVENGVAVAPGDFRFRVRVIGPFNVAGLINYVSEGVLLDLVMCGYSDAKRKIEAEQPTGTWVLAGWRCSEFYRNRRKKVPNPTPRPVEYTGSQDFRDGKPSPDATVPGWKRELALNIELVFVDTAKADEQDPWERETGRQEGVLQQWTRFGKLPPYLQKEREKALEILAQTFEHRSKPVEQAGIVRGPMALDDVNIAIIKKYLASGMDIADIAALTGHTVDELVKVV